MMAMKDEQLLHATKWGHGTSLSVTVHALFDRLSEWGNELTRKVPHSITLLAVRSFSMRNPHGWCGWGW
jgi:hypothetical protein